MALNYLINFIDFNGVDYEIHINNPYYDGQPINIEPAETPLVINWQGNNDDDIFITHIVPSNANINVINTGLDLNTLMYINDDSLEVIVYKSNSLYWKGFLISDGIQDHDSGVPFEVKLTAIDGLELLQNTVFSTDYMTEENALISYNGENCTESSPIYIMRYILFNESILGNKLPIRWNSSLKNDKYPADDMLCGRTKLGQLFFLAKNNINSFNILNDLAKSSQSWVYQKEGHWYINRYFDSIDNSFNGRSINNNEYQYQEAIVYNDNEVSEILPTDTINESWYWNSKKPLGEAVVTYNDFKYNGSNAIPNGDFDLLGLVWFARENKAILTPSTPINQEYTGYSLEVSNSTTDDDWVTFGEIPIDTNVLFKRASMGFKWLPISGYNLDGTGKVIDGQLSIRVSITAYQDGTLRKLYLNEFGFWSGFGIAYDGLKVVDVVSDGNSVSVRFSGSGAKSGQIFNISYTENVPNTPSFDIASSYQFTSDEPIDNALSLIASNTNGVVSGEDTILYSVENPSNDSAYITGGADNERFLPMQYTNAKLNDAVDIVFQSKGNSQGISLPDSGEISPSMNMKSGMLSVEFLSKSGTVMRLDDAYFRVENNSDVYSVKIDGSKNSVSNYSLSISSGFSGNMSSSYGDTYSTTNDSMFWNSGKTLTELYATAIMDIRNKPIRVFSGDIDKLMDWGLFKLMDKTYAPLSLSVNIKDRISTIVGAEFNPTPDNYTVTHKSSGAN